MQHLINPKYTIKQVNYLLSFKLVIELEEPGKLLTGLPSLREDELDTLGGGWLPMPKFPNPGGGGPKRGDPLLEVPTTEGGYQLCDGGGGGACCCC